MLYEEKLSSDGTDTFCILNAHTVTMRGRINAGTIDKSSIIHPFNCRVLRRTWLARRFRDAEMVAHP